jgi:hypothetical protein
VNERVEIMFKKKLIIYNLRNCGIVICDTFVALLVCWDDVIISKSPKDQVWPYLEQVHSSHYCDS